MAVLSTITITGRLDYQVCDDPICFAPKSVPVSDVIRLRPLAATPLVPKAEDSCDASSSDWR